MASSHQVHRSFQVKINGSFPVVSCCEPTQETGLWGIQRKQGFKGICSVLGTCVAFVVVVEIVPVTAAAATGAASAIVVFVIVVVHGTYRQRFQLHERHSVGVSHMGF